MTFEEKMTRPPDSGGSVLQRSCGFVMSYLHKAIHCGTLRRTHCGVIYSNIP